MYIYICIRTHTHIHASSQTRTSSAVAVTMVGGTHILQSKFEPLSALAAIRVHGITTLVVVPAMLGTHNYTYALCTHVSF